MNKLNDLVDGIIFINLEKRKDRYEHIMEQFNKYNFDLNKVHRLEATYIETNGAKGCSHSHYRAIQMAIDNNWENVLIMEDDAVFVKDMDYIYDLILKVQEYDNNWDVIMPYWLMNKKEKRSRKILDNVLKVCSGIGAHTTLCYMVNKRMFKKLLINFKESYELQHTISDEETKKYVVDHNWFKLQKRNNWYLLNPPVLIQLSGYSDISNRNIDFIDPVKYN